jgi:hypothetical protein
MIAPNRPNVNHCAGRSALFVAHPGHELRLHGWLGRARPWVFVLTDGSGGTGRPRLSWTTEVLRRSGARPGSPYGRCTDADVYRALLDGRHDLFLGLVEEAAAALVRLGVTCLVADAADGYNPSHDVCRLLAGAAAEVARRRTGRPLVAFESSATGRFWPPGRGRPPGEVLIRLSDDEFARKMRAARAYAPLRHEVEAALADGGAALRTERLRPIRMPLGETPADSDLPEYERHGAARVAAGLYAEVVRYRRHVAPLRECLRVRLGGLSCAA